MHTLPFRSLEDFTAFLTHSSPGQFREALMQFSLIDQMESLKFLQSEIVPNAQEKLEFLFETTHSREVLELFGKHLTTPSLIKYLDFLAAHPPLQNRLAFILTHLDPQIFFEALDSLEEKHLDVLKHEGLQEPLQYQITQFIHEGENLKAIAIQYANQFERGLSSLVPGELSKQSLDQLINEIEFLRKKLSDYDDRARKALALVWNTDRVDLIDRLSSVHEGIQHQLNLIIGKRSPSPTGLYTILETSLSKIYHPSLKDEDSAIEGLLKLSIWQLDDYKELGLIADIQKNANKSELDPIIRQRLASLDISTVACLKKHWIYSKSLLKEYIQSHSVSL